MRPIIFLNGPPGAGKDTLGAALAHRYRGFEIAKFAWELKERTHALYGDSKLPHDHFEDCKNDPHPFFMGLTPRQAYIAVSENLIKRLHGDHIFGQLLVERLNRELPYARGYIITDSGFECEAVPVLRHFGSENCILVRIHADGRGCSFNSDSRSYLDLPIESLDVFNNNRRAMFITQAAWELDRMLQPRMQGEFV